jgi:probable HAF family extracellular repeat protein
VFLDSSGDFTALPLPSAPFPVNSASAAPIRINSSGDIAANVNPVYCSSGATPKSVIYRNGIATCLNVGPGFIAAMSINDSGVVVGEMFDFVPFVYSGGLDMQITGFIGGSAKGINNSGQVVGSGALVIAGSSGAGAFLYSDGVVTGLNALGGFTSSSANAINSTGAVVGSSNLSSPSEGFAFLYTAGTLTDLNTLVANDIGTRLNNATGINDSEQIIAGGANGHAFLLTPVAADVPEPANGALFMAGIILLLAVRAGRHGCYQGRGA